MKRSSYTLLIALLVAIPLIVQAASFWSPFSGGGSDSGLSATVTPDTSLASNSSYLALESLVTVTMSSGTTAPAFGSLIVIATSDGVAPTYKKAIATSTTTMPAPVQYVVVSVTSPYSTSAPLVMSKGYIRYDSYTALITGRQAFVSSSTSGVPTGTVPSTAGNQVQSIGVGLTLTATPTAKILFFWPSPDVRGL